jgi:hypothetical protein
LSHNAEHTVMSAWYILYAALAVLLIASCVGGFVTLMRRPEHVKSVSELPPPVWYWVRVAGFLGSILSTLTVVSGAFDAAGHAWRILPNIPTRLLFITPAMACIVIGFRLWYYGRLF